MVKVNPWYIVVIIGLVACVTPQREKEVIEGKLHALFPEAKELTVLDSMGISKEKDTGYIHLPMPDYKAMIRGERSSCYDIILYFYNLQKEDTSRQSSILNGIFVHDVAEGLGTKESGYVIGMPRLNRSGNKMIVMALSFAIDSVYIIKKDKGLTEAFGLQPGIIKPGRAEEQDTSSAKNAPKASL